MSLRKRIHAHLLEYFSAKHDPLVEDRKRELLGPLKGSVLEIGPGTGVNLRFYAPGVRWIGVEPNAFMYPYLERRASAQGRRIELLGSVAEGLPLADESVDHVVSTLVLCSVNDPQQVLKEIYRVLKPGGTFVFIEHVADEAGSTTRRRQDWIEPVWAWFADGCHPNRETWKLVESAGFREVNYEFFKLKLPIVGPHLAGAALK